MTPDIEARIWCPRCAVVKYEVHRIPTGAEGVYVHKPVPPENEAKVCECGTNLERKP